MAAMPPFDIIDSALESILAGNFAAPINDIPEVYVNTTIGDVVKILETERFVLLKAQDDQDTHETTPDKMYCRIAFLKGAMKELSKDKSICSISEHIVAMETVGADDTLDIAFRRMLVSEKEEIFVFDKGTACGLITFQGILGYLSHQEQIARMNSQILERVSSLRRTASETPQKWFNQEKQAWRHQGSQANVFNCSVGRNAITYRIYV